ncbi:hypothetical protein AYO41_02785 [Verrucomicrobia bacterium SCGC AG-212-E04]|nr:hypothetical protein AYO41_02785 [Verrucomicrobia bacterium SCGC AG-212-E04]
MRAVFAFLKRGWHVFRRLHLALYFLFAMMVGLGGIVASMFEQYSVADFKSGLSEMQRAAEAKARGEDPEQGSKRLHDALKPLDRKAASTPINFKAAAKSDARLSLGAGAGWWTYALIVIWLWPLYRHHFSSKPQNQRRVEQRIVDLPVFLFALTWLVALGHYFTQVTVYRDLYGEPDLRIKTTFAAGAFLLGAFAGYLNLEVTQLYVRRRIARLFFREHNPHGLKSGLRVGLTSRHALMIFSLATVPLALCVYIPAFFNWDLFTTFMEKKSGSFMLEQPGIVIPLMMTTFIAAIMLCFHGLSVLLFRWNVQKPVGKLIERMRDVAAGNFEHKTSVLDSDEIGQLKGHFNMMLDGLQERDKIKDTFGRYVSIEIAEKIIKSGKLNLAGEEIEATVLFSDIRNFTALSETLPAPELVRFLNAYFSHVTRPIMDSGGVINKFMGDAVMAIFSPVFGLQDHVAAAVRASLGMRAALADFNRTGEYLPVLAGVGLHTGRLVAGNVGTDRRMEYTVLGDTVNVASRIESQTKEQQTDILVSGAVVGALDLAHFAGVVFKTCGPILLRGKSVPMELFRIE